MKKTFLKFFAAVLMVGFAAVSVGCKDYDDDIDSLNSAVAGLQQTVSSLQSQINNGKTISSVTNTADGVTVTLSDGSSFTITNGKDGKDGSDGAGAASSVWTIGDDGFWYQNGEKTDVKAVGTDGKYYVPVTDKESEYYGKWQAYLNGKAIEGDYTEESWLGQGLTAVKDGNTLTFFNVEGAEDGVVLSLGGELGSLVFDPEVILTDLGYPTTATRFYTLSFKPFTDNAWTTAKNATLFSNVVEMPYFINPAEAYVDTTVLPVFVAQMVETRANPTADTEVIVADASSVVDGQLIVKAKLADDEYVAEGNEEGAVLVAAQQWNGTQSVTSDFVAVETPIALYDVALGKYNADAYKSPKKVTNADWSKSVQGQESSNAWRLIPATFYVTKPTDKTFNTSAWVKELLTYVGSHNTNTYASYFWNGLPRTAEDVFVLPYNNGTGKLELAKVVKLYAQLEKDGDWKKLEDLGFEDITYTYTKIDEFKPTDDVTNQQKFIEVSSDGVVTVSEEYGTAAGDRYPVIYVTASIEGKMVATGYVVVHIIKSKGTSGNTGIEFSYAESDRVYNDLAAGFPDSKMFHDDVDSQKKPKEGTYNIVAEMTWEDINKQIYKQLGVTASEFWKEYDQENVQIKLTVEAQSKDEVAAANKIYGTSFDASKAPKDDILTLVDTKVSTASTVSGDMGQQKNVSVKFNSGVEVMIQEWNAGKVTSETSRIRIAVNENVLTQHTYAKYEDKGAHYTVTITVNPIDGKYADALVLTHDFYVAHDHKSAPEISEYVYTDAAKAELNARGAGLEDEVAKEWAYINGRMESNVWAMEATLASLFKSGDLTNLGGNIEQAYFWFSALGTNDTYEKNGTNGLNTDSGYFSAEFKDNKTNEVAVKDNTTKIGLALSDTKPMVRSFIVRQLNYRVELKNQETCYPDYIYVVFKNPFAAETTKSDIAIEDNPGTWTAHLGQALKVTTDRLAHENDDILTWDATTKDVAGDSTSEQSGYETNGLVFQLSKIGTGYGLKFRPGVNNNGSTNHFVMAYEMDEEADGYVALEKAIGSAISTRLTAKAGCSGDDVTHVDETTAHTHKDAHCGLVTWVGNDTRLKNNYDVAVKATVTIGKTLQISCDIPVRIAENQ